MIRILVGCQESYKGKLAEAIDIFKAMQGLTKAVMNWNFYELNMKCQAFYRFYTKLRKLSASFHFDKCNASLVSQKLNFRQTTSSRATDYIPGTTFEKIVKGWNVRRRGTMKLLFGLQEHKTFPNQKR